VLLHARSTLFRENEAFQLRRGPKELAQAMLEFFQIESTILGVHNDVATFGIVEKTRKIGDVFPGNA
jgi:hypothetical protein